MNSHRNIVISIENVNDQFNSNGKFSSEFDLDGHPFDDFHEKITGVSLNRTIIKKEDKS